MGDRSNNMTTQTDQEVQPSMQQVLSGGDQTPLPEVAQSMPNAPGAPPSFMTPDPLVGGGMGSTPAKQLDPENRTAAKPVSMWQKILTGALVGLAGGAGTDSFGAGLAGGAKAQLQFGQQQKDNEFREQEFKQRKTYQDAESAYRVASLRNQDQQLQLQTQEFKLHQAKWADEHIKFRMDNIGEQFDAIPNTGDHAMDYLQQGAANSPDGLHVPPGSVVTDKVIYVPKPGVNTIKQQFDFMNKIAPAMGLPVPNEQQWQTLGSAGRSAAYSRVQNLFMGLDPATGEYYSKDKIPGVIGAMNTNIERYSKNPDHNPEVLKQMTDSKALLQAQLKSHDDNEVNSSVAKAKALIPVEVDRATQVARASQRVADANAPMPEVDPTSQSILAQTGLSMPAFFALTGNMSQLPRDKATRAAAMNEAQSWANKKGVDVSTLASQYKTYNEVLSSNLDRMNRTKIMEQELQGTIVNLQGVANDKDLGKLKFANVAKIWAGQEVNDELAQQYAMHLYQLRNELAGYGAATQGRSGNSITLQDMKEAEQTIKNGISKGGLTGLQTAVENSTSKMGEVMSRSVDTARKGIWDLFGVGANYKGGANGQKKDDKQQTGWGSNFGGKARN